MIEESNHECSYTVKISSGKFRHKRVHRNKIPKSEEIPNSEPQQTKATETPNIQPTIISIRSIKGIPPKKFDVEMLSSV